jgi:hypothetical protein
MASYNGEDTLHVEAIERAKAKVARAMEQYRKDGNYTAVNRATRELADANQAYYRQNAGLAFDDR